MDQSPAPAPGPPPFAWWCARCQRIEPFGFDLLRRFVRDGWPVCCGEAVLAVSGRAVASDRS